MLAPNLAQLRTSFWSAHALRTLLQRPKAGKRADADPAPGNNPSFTVRRPRLDETAHLDAVFEHAPVGMAICRLDDAQCLRANAALCAIVEQDPRQLSGASLLRLLRLDSGQSQQLLERLRSGAPGPATCERRFRTGGATRWIRIQATLLPAHPCTPREVLAVVQDITEAKDSERRRRNQAERFIRAKRDLEHSRAELEEFTYAASHDLKQPIRAVSTHAAFLLEDHEHTLPEDGRARVRAIQDQARRMQLLLDAGLTHVRYGREPLRRRHTTLEAVLARVREILAPELAARSATLTLETQRALFCDPDWLVAALVHLVRNASMYSNRAERSIIVRAQDTPDRGLVISVADDGIGIPPQHREAVFKMFKRLHAPERYGGGPGAGLTIARRIIERHCGTMWIDSAHEGNEGTDGGTVISFTLGADREGPDAAKPAAHPDR